MITICVFGVQTSRIWCGDVCVFVCVCIFQNHVYICGSSALTLGVIVLFFKQGEFKENMSQNNKSIALDTGIVPAAQLKSILDSRFTIYSLWINDIQKIRQYINEKSLEKSTWR